MKVYLHPCIDGDIREALITLLTELGFEVLDWPQELDPNSGEMIVDAEAARPACIVVLSSSLTADSLEPQLTAIVGYGCRVIGIWPPDGVGNASAISDYGADTVAWDPERIRDAICGTPQQADPTGNPMPQPKTDHGGC